MITTRERIKIHIWQAGVADGLADQGLVLGQVLEDKNRLLVRTDSGMLEIMEAKIERQYITEAELEKIIGGRRSWGRSRVARPASEALAGQAA